MIKRLVLILALLLPTASFAMQPGCAFRVTPGTSLIDINQSMLEFLRVGSCLFEDVTGKPMVVSAIVDGNHLEESLHFVGLAVDVQVKDLPEDQLAFIMVILTRNFSDKYVFDLKEDYLCVQIRGERV